MADGYSWSGSEGGYRLPGSDHLGWWAAVAMILSVLLHIGVFFVLDRMRISVRSGGELTTGPVHVSRVETEASPDRVREQPEATITPPQTTDALLEEVDVLEKLPENAELDIKPDVKQAEYAVQVANPLQQGDPQTLAAEVASSFEVEDALPEFGRQPETIRPAAVGQLTVDPGAVEAENDNLGKLAEDLIRKGVGGTVKQGALEGVASLDDLLGLPPNSLLAKKTLLPSDLLFEFNSSELRESARVGLMKLALLMDRNSGLYCWIEGHTDLIGGDESNLQLSIRRAEAVKQYLVDSLRMNAERIHTRGFGRYQPIVTSGNAGQQAINRRVEVRMRKTPPTEEQRNVAPEKAGVIEEPHPEPVLVKPKRALPVEEPPAPRARPAPPPRAIPAEPAPIPERAVPVEESEIPLRPLIVPGTGPSEE
ncbi:MAG: OmpA family protein [Verrucomicrobiota bacterium]